MASSIRIGMLTPSSNTVLEPVTTAMLAPLSELSVHYARFPVTEIALSRAALGQFDEGELLRAARLLAHARVHAILWNGTSAGWLGFERDERLRTAIEQDTGIACGTSVLALNEILARRQIKRLALVTPYRSDVQQRIIANYASLGHQVVAERHLNLQDNFSFAEVSPEQLRALAREVAAERPQALVFFCTNLRGAPLARDLEDELGIAVYDTVALAAWKALGLTGVDRGRVQGWGSLFREA